MRKNVISRGISNSPNCPHNVQTWGKGAESLKSFQPLSIRFAFYPLLSSVLHYVLPPGGSRAEELPRAFLWVGALLGQVTLP